MRSSSFVTVGVLAGAVLVVPVDATVVLVVAAAGVVDDEAAVPCVGCVDGLDVALGVLDKCVARSAMNCCP